MISRFGYRSIKLMAAAIAAVGSVAIATAEGVDRTETSLSAARKNFVTSFGAPATDRTPIPPPPRGKGSLVRYPSAIGALGAYVSASPKDKLKHPAIVWITGGSPNAIDDGVWASGPAENDQTARQFREAGIITMYPSLRGGNDNPGRREGFFGEVNDVLAAADYLAAQPGVDPDRVYLGGHSTGATLVLLVAESSPRFRATFAFGPATDPADHRRENVPLDPANVREMALRRPIDWLDSVRAPLHVFEGDDERGNLPDLEAMQRVNHNPLVHFYPVHRANHFTILAPTNTLIARKILKDTGTTSMIDFSSEELDGPFRK